LSVRLQGNTSLRTQGEVSFVLHQLVYHCSMWLAQLCDVIYVEKGFVSKKCLLLNKAGVCVCVRMQAGGWARAHAHVSLHTCRFTYPVCHVQVPYCLRPVWLHHIFRHYLINSTIFGKKSLNIRYVPWFSLQLCFKHFTISEKISELLSYVWKCLHVKHPLCLSDFNETWIFLTDCKKKCQILNFINLGSTFFWNIYTCVSNYILCAVFILVYQSACFSATFIPTWVANNMFICIYYIPK
jgi:hypothetical protein